MKYQGVFCLTVAIVLLITWQIFMNSVDLQNKVKNSLGFDLIDVELSTVTTPSAPKCSLSKDCQHNHFAFRITSGAANVVGPKICFNGKNIMSHVLNNVGPGLNIVVVNGENGVVEKFGYLNINAGNPEDILAYLKEIKPGMIVLVASFDDVATKLTDEMREIFVGMGSTLISSMNPKDNWVFAGRAGTSIKSLFEKLAVNDENTNFFEGWPEMVEVGGCFPRTQMI